MGEPDLNAWALQYGPVRLRRRISPLAKAVAQRLSRHRDTGPGPLDGDAEVEALVELWAVGLLSASVLQQIGAAAHIAAPRPQMEVLARLGHFGRYTNNISRDLRGHLRLNTNDLPEPYVIKIDVESDVESSWR